MNVVATDTLNGRLEIQEAFSLQKETKQCRAMCALSRTYRHGCCDFRANSTGNGRLVTDQQPASLTDRLADSVDVPRHDGTQIDHLAGNVFFRGQLRYLAENVNLRAPRNHGHVGTLLNNLSFGQWNSVFFDGHVFFR